MKTGFLLIINLLLLGFIADAQTYNQLGSDINGISLDNFGTTVASSADGSIIAASGPTVSLRGEVKIYELSGASWVQRGVTLTGEADSDNYGNGLSMSADGSILAIGAPANQATFGEFSSAGRVYIYEWDGSSTYTQIAVLDASASGEFFGDAVSISNTGDILAVGATSAAGGGNNRGVVRVYKRSGNNYLPLGSDINGEQDFKSFGFALDLAITATDSILVVSEPFFSAVPGNNDDNGQVSIYNFVDGSWGGTWSTPQTILGDLNAVFGNAVSLTDDGAQLAVGTSLSFSGAINTYVEVYEHTTSWQLKGSRITSSISNDEFSKSVALAGDGTHLLVGAPGFVDPDSPNGYVNIYEFATADWNLADSIVGDASEDIFGTALATTTTGEQFVVGAPLNDAGGDAAGQVKMFGPATPDTTPPTATISIENDITNVNPIVATITFSEAIDLIADSLTLNNGTITDLSSNPENTVYTLIISPNAPSEFPNTGFEVSVALEAGKVEDAAGNANAETVKETVVFDDIVPTVRFVDFASNPIVSTSGTVEGIIVFSEGQNINLTQSDIQVIAGTIGQFIEFPNATLPSYAIEILPAENATEVQFTVAAELATDAAGNKNKATTINIAIDNTPPKLLDINPKSDNPTNEAPIPVTLTFSEKVKRTSLIWSAPVGFNLGELSTEDSITYNMDVVPTVDEGTLSLTVFSGLFTDLAGNDNVASETFTIEYDTKAPMLTYNEILTNNPNPVLKGTVIDEETEVESLIVNINQTDYNAEIADANWTLSLTDFAEGSYEIEITAQDKAGNETKETFTEGLILDLTAPSVEILGLRDKITEQVTITFSFSEAITGFEEDDVEVNNAVLSQFKIVDNQNATALLKSTVGLEIGSTISISVGSKAFEDLVGNQNVEVVSVSTILGAKYSGGTGTAEDPYLIGREQDLRELSDSPSDFSAYFEQIANIEMSDTGFKPIANDAYDGTEIGFSGSRSFRGVFDGKGFYIKNLQLDDESEAFSKSFFTYVSSATLKNINLINSNYNAIGTLIFGGLVGVGNDVDIQNCSVIGVINSKHTLAEGAFRSQATVVGGLIGRIGGNNTIKGSFTDIDINFTTNGTEQLMVGGLVGITNGDLSYGYEIDDSYSLSTIAINNSGKSQLYIGGLIGFSGSRGDEYMRNSYFAGRIVRTQLSGIDVEYIGGLLGSVSTIDGFTKFTNVFWDKDVASFGNPVGRIGNTRPTGNGYSTFQIKQSELLSGISWDISKKIDKNESTVWKYNPQGYPYLNWQDETFEEFTVGGQIVDENGNPFAGATVELGKQEGATQLKNSATTDNNGNFTVQSPSVGFHSITVKPNNENYETTYFGDTKNPLYTRQIHYDRSMTISLVPKVAPQGLDGAGTVKGNVVSANGATRMITGRMLDGEPLVGVQVSLLRVSDNEILITVETGENGVYEITGIPAGEYQLLLNLPGVDVNLEGSSFSMDEEGTPLVISAAVSEEGVVFNIEEEVLGIENEIEVAVYPNPVRDFVNVQIPGNAVARIIDVNGTVLKEESFTDNLKLNISELHSNMYFLEITNANGKAMKKLVKN